LPTPRRPTATWQTQEDQSEALKPHGKALRPAPQSTPTRFQRPSLPKSTPSLSELANTKVPAAQSSSMLWKQKINEAVTFFKMHGDRPLTAKGVITNVKLFDHFAAQGLYSTNVMLLLSAITHTKASVFQFVDDGTHRCITRPDYSAQLTSIIVVSFSKIAESNPVGHWITVHANLTERLIRIYDSMDVQARQLTSEEELPMAYLQPIKLIRESFPFVTALGVDRRIFLTPLNNPETIETVRRRHCQQALEALELFGEVIQPATSDELELQFDGSESRKRPRRSSLDNTMHLPLSSKKLRRSSSNTTKSLNSTSEALEAPNYAMDDDDDDDDVDEFDPLSTTSNSNSDEENSDIDAGGTAVKVSAGSQISEQNHLSTWTSEEDRLVVEKKNAGLGWSKIAQYFKYRSKAAVQARFYEIEQKTYRETIRNKTPGRPRHLAPPKSDRFRASTSRGSRNP
ncbi:MAG: hypothetical protein Q9192_008151, partial [Flavoplaca navasiana]